LRLSNKKLFDLPRLVWLRVGAHDEPRLSQPLMVIVVLGDATNAATAGSAAGQRTSRKDGAFIVPGL
jgi:hypothetical protein